MKIVVCTHAGDHPTGIKARFGSRNLRFVKTDVRSTPMKRGSSLPGGRGPGHPATQGRHAGLIAPAHLADLHFPPTATATFLHSLGRERPGGNVYCAQTRVTGRSS